MVFSSNCKPIAIVECKALKVNISQKVFNQIARYNMNFKVPILIVTNGINHYCCWMDYENQNFNFLKSIPNYTELKQLL